ncbi:MAG: hypothetical protein QG555_11 [Thermodesulfobacteriota bacterium]|nr:hypothetical protein [Thermodesulfobacteriota bacterium]
MKVRPSSPCPVPLPRSRPSNMSAASSGTSLRPWSALPRSASPTATMPAWGDGNGYAHVRAALLGPSVTIPVAGGRLVLGTWQQLVLVDFDNHPRQRRIFLQISGL